jgi:hypothetical protein
VVKFEDLEIGKDYILINTGVYTYPADFYKMQRITVIRKIKGLPLSAENNSILERRIYDEVGYLDEYNSQETISTYKDRHLKCVFIGLDEDIEKEIEPLIAKYSLEKSNRIKERYEQEKKELENNMADVRKAALELIEED